jgi:hypothetical protein
MSYVSVILPGLRLPVCWLWEQPPTLDVARAWEMI